ncbi:MAG: S9 family peptidase [Gammaproteobacteria bacterium]
MRLLQWAIIGMSLMISTSTVASTKPLDAETMWKIQRLGSPALSPDGSRAVVPVTGYDIESGEGATRLWMIPAEGGDPSQLTSDQSGTPSWSPDGRYIAFAAKRGSDEVDQLYVIPANGGEARRLTDLPADVTAIRWFPDSTRLAFVTRIWPELESWEAQAEKSKSRAESKMSAMVWDRPPIRWWSHWIDDREAHIFAIAVSGGEPAGVTPGSGLKLPEHNTSETGPGIDAYDISPDGKTIAFNADTDGSGVDSNYDVYLIPAGGGEAQNISSDNPGHDSSPLFSPDGRWLVYSRQLIKGFYGDKERLIRHDLKTGEQTDLTESWDRSVSGLVWGPDSKGLYGAIDDAGHSRVYEIAIKDGAARAITGPNSFSALAVAGQSLVGLRQSFIEPATLVRIDPDNGKVRKLSRFNDEVLAGVDFGTFESVTYTGALGEPVQMWINFPPGFDKSKRWPLYLLLHGGPHNGITDSFHYRWNAQVFSGWGYVTAWHNFHGSSGFGQAFTDSINPNQADLPYQDTILAAEYLAAKPWIDPDRMAAGGGSFGGYLASILLGNEHPFKTLVAHAAVYNWLTQYGADYGAGKRRFGEHWESQEIFSRNSPTNGADAFSTPTLVIHGEQDYRVPLNHGIELYQTLQNKGVRSRLVYFPDENHWVLKRDNSIFWYQQKRDWLKEFIGAGPTP